MSVDIPVQWFTYNDVCHQSPKCLVKSVDFSNKPRFVCVSYIGLRRDLADIFPYRLQNFKLFHDWRTCSFVRCNIHMQFPVIAIKQISIIDILTIYFTGSKKF